MTTSAAKKAEIVAYLEQIVAIQNEGDNDVVEVRIAKLGDGIHHSKELNHHEKHTAGEILKIRDWNALKKYLVNMYSLFFEIRHLISFLMLFCLG